MCKVIPEPPTVELKKTLLGLAVRGHFQAIAEGEGEGEREDDREEEEEAAWGSCHHDSEKQIGTRNLENEQTQTGSSVFSKQGVPFQEKT